MKNSDLWAQGSKLYEQLKVMDDISLSIQASRGCELFKVMDHIDNFGWWV